MIGKDSKKVQIIMKKKEVKILEKLAQREQRTISQMGAILIRKQLSKVKKGEK